MRSTDHDQIHQTSDERIEAILQGKLLSQPMPEVVAGWVFHEELDVAEFRIGVRRAAGAERLRPQDTEIPAQGVDALRVIGDERVVEAHLPIRHDGARCSGFMWKAPEKAPAVARKGFEPIP